MNRSIPLSIPNLSDTEKKYVLEAIDDGWVSSAGPHVTELEHKFAEYIGVDYAIACSSGTAALHISLILKGVGNGDEVLVPNMTFVATANAVKYVGADPVFLDIDPNTLGICINSLRVFLDECTVIEGNVLINRETGKRVAAILPVHMLGTPVDMDPLNEICRKYGVQVIEDATESLGSKYKGKLTGGLSDVACFSFNGNKIITTGGGGMITTNDKALATKAKHLTTTAKTDPIFFDHDEIGFNYRLVNVLAALGLGQLSRLEEFLEKKRRTHLLYSEYLSREQGVTLFQPPAEFSSNYWLNMISFDEQVMTKYNLRQLVEYFAQKGIQTRPMWTLLSNMPMYQNCIRGDLSKSEALHSCSLTIPSSTCIERDDIKYVTQAIKELL